MRAQDLTFLSNVSQVDWARLAAYIDGEGCIRIASNKGAKSTSRRVFYLDLTIVNTDPRLGQWLQATFGGSVFVAKRGHFTPTWAPLISWNIASAHAAEVLRCCMPYFIIKREQAETALAFQATILPDRRFGRKGRPPELVAQQQRFYEQLQSLKGTSSRPRRAAASTLH